jgi:hypothetical protein
MLVFALVTLVAVLQASSWVDPARHQVQIVNVADGVQLEVLDFGGSGRPIVLLAGFGNTAHVYDELAPKLTGAGHVPVHLPHRPQRLVLRLLFPRPNVGSLVERQRLVRQSLQAAASSRRLHSRHWPSLPARTTRARPRRTPSSIASMKR